MGKSNQKSAPSPTRVVHVHVDADLHRALLIYEASHGLTHTETVEAALRLLLSKEVQS